MQKIPFKRDYCEKEIWNKSIADYNSNYVVFYIVSF